MNMDEKLQSCRIDRCTESQSIRIGRRSNMEYMTRDFLLETF